MIKKKLKKIAVITGSRAEFGHFTDIIDRIRRTPELELQLIVTGMHLSPKFGMTVREIEKTGVPIAGRVDMLSGLDTAEGVALSMGNGTAGFARLYKRLKPDIVVVLGDRFEIFSAAAAAVPFRIPIAHIAGGELTEGAMDEQFRHSITKMSHVHFASTETYRNRIIKMGEEPSRVHCFGAPAIDAIMRARKMSRAELCKELGIPDGARFGVVTYHPETLESDDNQRRTLNELFRALDSTKGLFWVITYPNADTGNSYIIRAINRFAKDHPGMCRAYRSLGVVRYASALRHAELMVGNSSSGIIEAPSFRLPVVNIGSRQQGRLRARNVIDVPECRKKAIEGAVRKALSPAFISSLKYLRNPYGSGNASEKIVEKLTALPIGPRLLKKRFYE